jgi:hypothetical protein
VSDDSRDIDEARAERVRLVETLESRAAALEPAQIRARFRTAAAEFEAALAGVTEAEARRPPAGGGWSIATIVDHVAQSTIRGVDELRHLLAGRRPPGPPVYDGLVSGAAAWVAWEELREGLTSANAAFDALLASTEAVAATAALPGGAPRARTILVVNRTLSDGQVVADLFGADLEWKAYALVQRLHLLDHRNQVRALRAEPGAAPAARVPHAAPPKGA